MPRQTRSRSVAKGIPSKLLELPPNKLNEVDALLRDGVSALKVAKKIHEEWGLVQGVNRTTLHRYLLRYVRNVVRKRTVEEITERALAVNRQRATTHVVQNLNVIDEVERLVVEQKERVEAVARNERKTGRPQGMLLKMVTEEMRFLKDLLVELGRLQLETGIMSRAPKHMTGTLVGPDGRETHFDWTEEQEELYRVIEGETVDDG